MTSQQDFTLFVIVIALSFLIMVTFLVGIMLNIFRQRVLNQKKILDAIYNAQENEKTRIAEDLHDNLGASLSALKLHIDEIREESKDSNAVEMVNESSELLDSIVNDLRYIVRNQASKYLITNGFHHELERFKNNFSRKNKIKFTFEDSKQLPSLDNKFGINLFRIIQELINNSIKHSGCSEIILKLSKNGSHLELFYEDNGKGFDADAEINSGMGLSNINARVKLFNGKYQLETSPGNNTRYKFQFDIDMIN